MGFIPWRNPATGKYEFVDLVLEGNIASIKATVEATELSVNELLSMLNLEREREVLVFPKDTSRLCTVSAGNLVNTWGPWTEIVDSLADSFSSEITQPTHVLMVTPEQVSDRNQVYMLEVAYGGDLTIVSRRRFSPDRELGVVGVELFGPIIPAGEMVYARMMCTSALETADIVIRYHYHPVL